MTDKSFTGRKASRKTTRRVQLAESVSRWCITIGGLGTIVAVTTIFLFLVWVVLPLFGDSTASEAAAVAVANLETDRPVAFGTDEQQFVGWTLLEDGTACSYELSTGAELERRHLFDGVEPTHFDVSVLDGTFAAAFADGSVRLGRVGVSVEFITDAEDLAPLQDTIADLEPGDRFAYRTGRAEMTPALQVRYHGLLAEADEPVRSKSSSPVVRLRHVVAGTTRMLLTLREDGGLRLSKLRARPNLLTGKVSFKTTDTELPYEPRPDVGEPDHLLVNELGTAVYVAWNDGLLRRYEVASRTDVRLAETVNLLPGNDGTELTVLDWMLGRTTIVTGDSSGGVYGWFLSRREGDDETRLTRAHELPSGGSAVTALASSSRNRTLVAAFADGSLRGYYVPTDDLIFETVTDAASPAEAVNLMPRGDGMLALTAGGLQRFGLDAPHPETRLPALFGKVWYEGESGPVHVWQSSGATDDFEPKLGLMPLVFGTLKATVYSMIFSVPLAILAAIYTSEFLVRSARARVKQSIEMMATLPSVVLGFLAALWMAPLVETHLVATLMAFFAVPFTWLAGAYLWQLLPGERAVRLSGWPRMLLIAAAVPVGLLLGKLVAPAVEQGLLGGNVKLWLAGSAGEASGGWVLILAPLCALGMAWLLSRYVTPALRRASVDWTRRQLAVADLLKFGGGVVATLGLAWGLAHMLDGLGLDPRGGLGFGQLDLSPTSTYVQRNALIVGFVMGFAVVPIIYTLAEDALSSVPEHLRAASLATGATPWQTATRVVVPTAMSGLFSAVMIGLGRAVGETMVVLMAAGNTPLLEANLFNGFRTLSANIAVELPEAVQNGSLYRVLFLAALTLFAMTFVINTLAEIVRQRFRRRAYEL